MSPRKLRAARIRRGTPRAVGYPDWRWTTLAEAELLPFAVPDRKLTDALRARMQG